MPGMRDQFAHFYPLGDNAVKTAMEKGLVVPDTNVLLRLYEFKATVRDELFEALENLGDRLWIPYQVGHEVHRKRLEIIAKQEKFFKEAGGGLVGSIRDLRSQVGAFRTRLGLSKDDLQEIEERVGELQRLLTAEVNKARKANEVHLKDWDSDKVLDRLERLFDNRVGGPMEQGELEEARREAARRGREKIPPGYKDADKDKGDPAGDYLIWRQLMTEATTRKLPVVFITDDIKPDWYRVDQEIRLGARYELREEMMREAGVPLMMMTTRVFIDHAEKYLGDQFSEETKEQAKELPFVVRDDGPSSGGTSVSELLSVFTSWRHWSYGPTRHFMGSLRNELGDSEMEARVTQAVMEGEVSGILSRERGRLILGWMNRELAIGEPVNHDQPVDRDAFEAALAVPPEQDNPDEIWWSRRTIEMSMKRQDATADDLARGSAWLARSREARSIEG